MSFVLADDDGHDASATPAAISRKKNASELDKRVGALADRARAAHADPTLRVRRVAPWSLRERPR